MYHDHLMLSFSGMYGMPFPTPWACRCPKCHKAARLTSLGGGLFKCSECGIHDLGEKFQDQSSEPSVLWSAVGRWFKRLAGRTAKPSDSSTNTDAA